MSAGLVAGARRCLWALGWTLFLAATPASGRQFGAEDTLGAARTTESAAELRAGPNGLDPRLAVVLGTHLQLPLERPVTRVAVGDPTVLSFELLDELQLLLLGKSVGRTSLLVWSGDGPPARYAIAVEPDLSLLREALNELAPDVRVSSALDRDAIVLRGMVRDATERAAVEAAARAWLDADATAPTALGAAPTETAPQSVGQVISLLRVAEMPVPLEDRIAEAVREVGVSGVRVSRVQRDPQPNDAIDAFVLEGTVSNQTALTRTLLVAAAAIDPALVEAGIEVLADEAGGLRSVSNQLSNNQNNQQFASANQGGGVFQNGGGQGNQVDNRIQSNIGRATALSAAAGRVLSFLRVADLPQVRVDIELYEVDRTRLEQLDATLEAIVSDFSQGALSPLSSGLAAPPSVGSVSPTDAQGVLNLLNGAGSAGFQLADSRAAVSATLQALESRGYARSLSRPSITVLSGELAQFQVGGEIPVPTAFATTVGNGGPEGVFNGVAFRPFGVRLLVRPLVEPDGRITLDLVPEVVQPDTELTTAIRDATGAEPLTVGFETRALRTTARVGRGGSLVIGGLLQRSEQGSSSGVPWLSRLPGIGWLFGRESRQSAERELFVVVSPTQVHEPRPEARLWAHADPVELVLAGRQARNPREKSEPDGNSDPSAGISPSPGATSPTAAMASPHPEDTP